MLLALYIAPFAGVCVGTFFLSMYVVVGCDANTFLSENVSVRFDHDGIMLVKLRGVCTLGFAATALKSGLANEFVNMLVVGLEGALVVVDRAEPNSEI